MLEGTYKCMVEWKGFEPEDATWVEIAVVYKDAPDSVLEFLKNWSGSKLVLSKIKTVLGL